MSLSLVFTREVLLNVSLFNILNYLNPTGGHARQILLRDAFSLINQKTYILPGYQANFTFRLYTLGTSVRFI